MRNWTGNGVIDFILNVLLIILVVVLVVWAIKEIVPVFTDAIAYPPFEGLAQ